MAPPIQTDIVEEVKKQDQPPPPPPPQMERPPVEVPPPDVTINTAPEPSSTAITDVTNRPVRQAPPPPPRPVVRTGGGPGKNFPNTEDFYPEASKRLNEEGTAIVHACVGPDGRLEGTPTLQESSGKSRLDQAAIKLATAGSGKYKPATEDGRPVKSCFPFKIKFTLRG